MRTTTMLGGCGPAKKKMMNAIIIVVAAADGGGDGRGGGASVGDDEHLHDDGRGARLRHHIPISHLLQIPLSRHWSHSGASHLLPPFGG